MADPKRIAWGNDCESWHDDADDVNIAEFDGGIIPDDRFVMTTWHSDVPLAEALWFVASVAFHPTVDLQNVLILHVAQRARAEGLLEQFQVAAEK